jgi:hypothetical protein
VVGFTSQASIYSVVACRSCDHCHVQRCSRLGSVVRNVSFLRRVSNLAGDIADLGLDGKSWSLDVMESSHQEQPCLFHLTHEHDRLVSFSMAVSERRVES